MIISLIRQTTTLAIAAAATLVTIAASAAPADAAPVDAAPARYVAVELGRYNLASDTGRDRAADRLRRAVAQVCDQGETRSLSAQTAARACEAETLARVLPRLDTRVAMARAGRTDVAANELRRNPADIAAEPAAEAAAVRR